MIEYIIPLIRSYITGGLLSWFLYPMICLGLLFVFPSFVRSLVSWR